MNHGVAAALVNQSPDAIVFSDIQGVIRVWNPAATRVFGFTEDEAVGQNLDIIIPERFREAHWKGFERAISNRKTKYSGQALATRSVHSDGTPIYVELSFSVVVDNKGEVLGALAHARDITERFEKDRENRKRMQALEAELAKNA